MRFLFNYPHSVKFVLMPSSQVVTLACTLGQTLESLKSHFATELKMAASLIMLMFDGQYCKPHLDLENSFDITNDIK